MKQLHIEQTLRGEIAGIVNVPVICTSTVTMQMGILLYTMLSLKFISTHMCMEGWSGRGWGKGEGLEFHVPQQHLFGGFLYLSLSPLPRLWMTSVIFQLISGWVTGSHGDSEGSCQANTETKWKASMH